MNGGPIVSLRIVLISAVALVVGTLFAASPLAAAGGLDTPLVRWSGPHQGVPAPPVQRNTRTGQVITVEQGVQAMCLLRERAPITEEEKQVTAEGWRLVSYWPTAQWSDVAVVTATSWYDGMCRPWAYQAFAFVGGRFAGTLSPVAMNSRFDGMLFGPPVILPGAVIEATFNRYADRDPLCCPSLPRVRVRYELTEVEDGGRVFTPTVARQLPLPDVMPPQAPGRLPNTGDALAPLAMSGLAAGLLAILTAVVIRRWKRLDRLQQVASRDVSQSASPRRNRYP